MDENLIYWVWLTIVFGPANPRKWEVLRNFADVKEAYEKLSSGKFEFLNENEKKKLEKTNLSQAKSVLKYCENKGMKIYSYESEGFPQRLRDIYNPPSLIFCYGSLDYIDDSIAIAVVGARNPSEYSVKVCDSICTELSKIGTVIISGFALGIDSVAHKACLNENGRTVAVLGGGLDSNYPAQNAPLKKVVAKHGAVVSEYFPGTKAFGNNFRERNRIISALSLGVIVVEASGISGSLNTASHALEQGKNIFCVPPHDIFDERYVGVVSLLRDGAIPVFSHRDIVREYYENFSHKLSYAKTQNLYMGNDSSDSVFSDEKSIDEYKKKIKTKRKTKNTETIEPGKIKEDEFYQEKDTSGLSETQVKIFEAVKSKGEIHSDDLADLVEMDVSELLSELTELELFGFVKALPGKRYSV